MKPARATYLVGGDHTPFIGKHHPDFIWQTLVGEAAVALVVDVKPAVAAGRLPVQPHAERHRRPSGGRPHHEVHVAGLELELDARTRIAGHRSVLGERPRP